MCTPDSETSTEPGHVSQLEDKAYSNNYFVLNSYTFYNNDSL